MKVQSLKTGGKETEEVCCCLPVVCHNNNDEWESIRPTSILFSLYRKFIRKMCMKQIIDLGRK